ncbi:MAG: 2',5' RNA ligase family [bacterium ADurb.Bin400]|nr:MAG: 2',5' RNA ligase family [bacterium ADurb.Bin400]
MKHRIFVALEPSKELTDKLADWQRQHGDMRGIRWIKPRNLHITLIPPWHTHDIRSIQERLQLIGGGVGPIDLCFRKVDLGPNRSKPRLVWAVAPENNTINDTYQRVKKLLDADGTGLVAMPHITIGRCQGVQFCRELSSTCGVARDNKIPDSA